MQIGYITLQGRGLIDDCIASAVAMLQDSGIRIVGTVRDAPALGEGHACDMDLRVLPDGPSYRISQALGAASRGCRLDPTMIETIAASVASRLGSGQLLVINKFGKLECQGRGLSQVIAQATDMGMPVIVGVNGLNLNDFLAYAGEFAREVEAVPKAVFAWGLAAVTSTRAKAPVTAASVL